MGSDYITVLRYHGGSRVSSVSGMRTKKIGARALFEMQEEGACVHSSIRCRCSKNAHRDDKQESFETFSPFCGSLSTVARCHQVITVLRGMMM